MLVLAYRKCSTCQKALKWLEENNVEFIERAIVEENPNFEEIKEWYEKSGLPLKKFFNTSGLLYKDMKLKDKLPAMSEEEQLKLLATNGMLVKRPLVVGEDFVLTGFREKEWDEKMKDIKKIGIKELNEITCKDVYQAIDRWDSNEYLEVKQRKYDSKDYYLLYNGILYPTKPIFAVAYENHYGVKIKTTRLTGGISNSNCVVSHLRDRLKFAVISKLEIRKNEKKHDDSLIGDVNEISGLDNIVDETYFPVFEPRKKPILQDGIYLYPRDKRVALNALKSAGYQCECQEPGEIHPSFIRKTNGTNYTEPHHIVPMFEQGHFECNLDVQANIVSLCSNCHNQLHYGENPIPLLTKIYEARKEQLKAVGIDISLKELISYYK